MAAGLLRHLVKNDGRFKASDLDVRSAGTSARTGDSATSLAIKVMTRRGIDLSGHQATRLSPEATGRADMILTMTRKHKEEVLRRDPGGRARTFTLAEFAGEGSDVTDPLLEGTEAAYERCAEELSRVIPCVLERLLPPERNRL
jgi:protein-tyrosine-phosphatase